VGLASLVFLPRHEWEGIYVIKPRRILAAIAVLFYILSVTAGIVAAEGKGFVTTELLNVRKEPDKASEVVIRLAQGTEVQVLDTKGEWYQVSIETGETGWVVSEYVKADFDVVQIKADNVNVRKTPSQEGEVAAQVNKIERYIMVDRFNDWFKIKLANGESGWVNDQFAIIVGMISRGVESGRDTSEDDTIGGVTEPAKPTVKMAIRGDNVNFRDNPDLDAQVVDKLAKDAVVTVLESAGEWCKIKTADGKTGYINKMFLKDIVPEQTSVSTKANQEAAASTSVVARKKTVTSSSSSYSSSSSSSSSSSGSSSSGGSSSGIVAFAKKFIGIRYVWGGTTTKGFDCSGFTQYIMRNYAGVSIPRVSRDQAQSGTAVKKENLKVGDLVFFAKSASNRTINHVGMYIGNGQFIHSSSGGGGRGVTISNLNSGSYAVRYSCARRYL
jgi:cell wall-associated NlpC family hydrolase/uncharacterized protein YraI